ncbi:MAG: hypothetical protein ACPGUV_05995 [Polyangiales bacterium]
MTRPKTGFGLSELAAARHQALAAPAPAAMQPLATPLMLGGFTAAVTTQMQSWLQPLGLWPLQAGGAAPRSRQQAKRKARFVPGGAIGIELIRGDISATAVGTITHVDGHRLVAFGHPLMNAGQVALPTAEARVLHVMASLNRSFKVAEALHSQGTLVQDRLPAVVVDTARQAKHVPVTLTLRSPSWRQPRRWRMEVAQHPQLTPSLVFAALVNALQASASDQDHLVLHADARIHVAGRAPLRLRDAAFLPLGAADTGALSRFKLMRALEAVAHNPFEPAELNAVHVDMHLKFAPDIARITAVAVPSDEVDPGARVPVRVTLARYGHADTQLVMPLHIPAWAAGQTVRIEVAPGHTVALPQPQPRRLDDVLRALKAGFRADQLVLSLTHQARGLSLRGHLLPDVPASVAVTLQGVQDTTPVQPVPALHYRARHLPVIVAGKAHLKLQVRSNPQAAP